MINPVRQSFDALPERQATWHAQFIEGAHSWFKVLSISGRISSQPAVFSVLTARKTSSAVMIVPPQMYVVYVWWCDNDWF